MLNINMLKYRIPNSVYKIYVSRILSTAMSIAVHKSINMCDKYTHFFDDILWCLNVYMLPFSNRPSRHFTTVYATTSQEILNHKNVCHHFTTEPADFQSQKCMLPTQNRLSFICKCSIKCCRVEDKSTSDDSIRNLSLWMCLSNYLCLVNWFLMSIMAIYKHFYVIF